MHLKPYCTSTINKMLTPRRYCVPVTDMKWRHLSCQLVHYIFDTITSYIAQDTSLGHLQLEVRQSADKLSIRKPKLRIRVFNGEVKRVMLTTQNWVFDTTTEHIIGLRSLNTAYHHMRTPYVQVACQEALDDANVKLAVTPSNMNRLCREKDLHTRMILRTYKEYDPCRATMVKHCAKKTRIQKDAARSAPGNCFAYFFDKETVRQERARKLSQLAMKRLQSSPGSWYS